MAVRTAGEYASWLRYRASAKGKEMLRRVHARKREAFAAWIAPFKAKPCADCGNTFDPVCMDFDHRPGEVKLHNIGRLARSACSREVLDAEIAKCDLVCANCHRLRTKSRGQWSALLRHPPASIPELQLALFKEAA